MHSPRCFLARLATCTISVCGLLLCAMSVCTWGQSAIPPSSIVHSSSDIVWRSTQAKYRIGLPGVKPKASGTLTLLPTELVFTTLNGRASIERGQIFAVTVGGERKETGGIGASVARYVSPIRGWGDSGNGDTGPR